MKVLLDETLPAGVAGLLVASLDLALGPVVAERDGRAVGVAVLAHD